MAFNILIMVATWAAVAIVLIVAFTYDWIVNNK